MPYNIDVKVDVGDRLVSVAPRNTRYGKVPNVSLVPVRDCGVNSRYCKNYCYGVRNFGMYEDTRKAWTANSIQFRQSFSYIGGSTEYFLTNFQSKLGVLAYSNSATNLLLTI